MEKANLNLPDGQSVELPVVEGSENEKAVDIGKLRAQTGYITIDPGYVNTGSCSRPLLFWMVRKGYYVIVVSPSNNSLKNPSLSKFHTC